MRNLLVIRRSTESILTALPDDSQTSDTQAAALQADKQNEDTTFSSDKYALALDKSYGVVN